MIMTDESNTNLCRVYIALKWAEHALWSATGRSYAFESLLASCSWIGQDSGAITEFDNSNSSGNNMSRSEQHYRTVIQLLDELSVGDTKDNDKVSRIELSAVISAAAARAIKDANYARAFASVCDVYYFLRRLDMFSLNEQNMSKLISALRFERGLADEDILTADDTHQSTVDSLNACLGQLEANHPGIKVFVNCAMLEANIMQEFDVSFAPFTTLRQELSSDGVLYQETLACILSCLRSNADSEQVLSHTEELYQNEDRIFWPTVRTFIWELYNSLEMAHEIADCDIDEDDIDVNDDEYVYEVLSPSTAVAAKETAATGSSLYLIEKPAEIMIGPASTAATTISPKPVTSI